MDGACPPRQTSFAHAVRGLQSTLWILNPLHPATTPPILQRDHPCHKFANLHPRALAQRQEIRVSLECASRHPNRTASIPTANKNRPFTSTRPVYLSYCHNKQPATNSPSLSPPLVVAERAITERIHRQSIYEDISTPPSSKHFYLKRHLHPPLYRLF
ncbi:11557_t:CDS:1 [Acaulospora colombiana]|uniref:11557_t:CDS:1 n=1 Tax=Acaulospora colombiana TaxID=27376 RepID=A0ACA9Q5J6_9GLOM|nr:11557_t:CDS:1 [Acaulospora colombiana]